MKKLVLLSLVAVVGLCAESKIPLEIKPSIINYIYDFGKSKCTKMTFKEKVWYLDKQKDKTLIVSRNYDTIPGIVSETVSEIDGAEIQHVLAETYGSCKLYEDVVLKSKDVKDVNTYTTMKDPAIVK